MISIVRGNDFCLQIPVMFAVPGATIPFDFTGAEVTVNIRSCIRSLACPYSIDGNIIIVSVDGAKIVNGTYSIEFVIKKAGNMRSYIDKGFRIIESDTERTPVEVGVKTYELDARVLIDYGTRDYEKLGNKPSIGGVELSGDKSLADLGVHNYDDADILRDVAANKRGIEANAEEITQVDERAIQAEKLLLEAIVKKVDKVPDKGLSTNDYSNDEKDKLSTLSNYDDSQLNDLIKSMQLQFDTLLSGDATVAIESFNEIIAFLSNLEDSQTLDAIIAGLNLSIANVDKKIPAKVSQLLNDSGFLTKHQSLADYAKTEDVPTKVSELNNDSLFATEEYVDAAKLLLFVDMWNTEAMTDGKYNAATGFFELNGLLDITYKQAINIFNQTASQRRSNNLVSLFQASTIRTNFKFVGSSGGGGADMGRYCLNAFANSIAEVINVGSRFRPINISSDRSDHGGLFLNCSKLKTIQGGLSFMFRAPTSSEFSGCTVLENVNIIDLDGNLRIESSPNLTNASILMMCSNSTTKIKTFTFHPTAYARAIADESIVAKALEKNITLASA